MKPDPKEELREARAAARALLQRGVSTDAAARRLAAQFFIAVYGARGRVYASFADDKGKEEIVRLGSGQ